MKQINPTHFERIPALVDGDKNVVNAIIETPRDTRLKFAFEPEFGIFRLNQVLADGLQWPPDVSWSAASLGSCAWKKNGKENDRVLAAPRKRRGIAQSADDFNDVDDIPKETVESISRFLVEYSEEQGHRIEFKGVKSKKKAADALAEATDAYRKSRL